MTPIESKHMPLCVLLLSLLSTALGGCGAEKDGQQSVPDRLPTTTDPVVPEDASGPAKSKAVYSTDLDGEHLLAAAPQGWVKVYESLLDNLRLVEYVPGGSTDENWKEKLSFEWFNQKPLPDPIELVTGIADDQKETCEGFEDHNTFSGFENNYPTSVRLLICKQNKLSLQGQVSLIKTIQGEDGFYVVTRAKRIPPITEQASGFAVEDMARWSLHMRAISVCDPGRKDHPCATPDHPGVSAKD